MPTSTRPDGCSRSLSAELRRSKNTHAFGKQPLKNSGRAACYRTDKGHGSGLHYLTYERGDEPGAGKALCSEEEAIMAYSCGIVGMHAPIKVRKYLEIDDSFSTKLWKPR
jgi:hypothetical protein